MLQLCRNCPRSSIGSRMFCSLQPCFSPEEQLSCCVFPMRRESGRCTPRLPWGSTYLTMAEVGPTPVLLTSLIARKFFPRGCRFQWRSPKQSRQAGTAPALLKGPPKHLHKRQAIPGRMRGALPAGRWRRGTAGLVCCMDPMAWQAEPTPA